MIIPKSPELKFFATLRGEVGAPIEIGNVGGGVRRMVPLLGGTIEGVDFSGKILPGGFDYQLVVESRRAFLEARYVLEIEGELIYVCNKAVRTGTPDELQRMQRGESVPPGAVYSHSSPTFETASRRFAWLADRIFISGAGRRLPDHVEFSFFEVC